MRKAILIFPALALIGCAQPARVSEPFAYPPDPVCSTPSQCEAMWAQAPISISNVTGMKVRMQTDTYIETFDGTRQSRLYGRVVRMPNPDGGYTIKATVGCGAAGCGDLYLRAQAVFNSAMHAAGRPFGETMNPTTDPGSVKHSAK